MPYEVLLIVVETSPRRSSLNLVMRRYSEGLRCLILASKWTDLSAIYDLVNLTIEKNHAGFMSCAQGSARAGGRFSRTDVSNGAMRESCLLFARKTTHLVHKKRQLSGNLKLWDLFLAEQKNYNEPATVISNVASEEHGLLFFDVEE